MTEINATKTGNHITFSFKNHAQQDRVCTAVSTLACTLAGALQYNPEAVCVYQRLDPGDAKIEFIAQGIKAQEDAVVILIGLLALAYDYPDDVQVTQNIL